MMIQFKLSYTYSKCLIAICCLLISSFCIALPNPNMSRVIVFISFSMPEASIRSWLTQARKIHVPVVIRGLVNNSFPETLSKISKLVGPNNTGVQIDPELFKKFDIREVPAVVIREPADNCLPSMSCIENFNVLSGNVTFSYALSRFVREDDDLSHIAQKYLNQLETKHAA